LDEFEHRIASVLPPIRTVRGSAVAPSRFSTAYLRSKPVPIASPVNAADMTARVMMLGTTKSIRRGVPSEYSNGRLKKNSSSSGMSKVNPTCSPLRNSSRNSIAVCADSMRDRGAAPGAGANRPTVAALTS
jgi:hypothetical protein